MPPEPGFRYSVEVVLRAIEPDLASRCASASANRLLRSPDSGNHEPVGLGIWRPPARASGPFPLPFVRSTPMRLERPRLAPRGHATFAPIARGRPVPDRDSTTAVGCTRTVVASGLRLVRRRSWQGRLPLPANAACARACPGLRKYPAGRRIVVGNPRTSLCGLRPACPCGAVRPSCRRGETSYGSGTGYTRGGSREKTT